MELMKWIAIVTCSVSTGGALAFGAFVVVALKAKTQDNAERPEAGRRRAKR